MKVSYYPGCSLEATGRAYDHSVRAVCTALGVDLQEPPEWVCCGSSAALKMSGRLSTALSAQNLAILERQEPAAAVAPCPFCYRRLAGAQLELGEDPELKREVQEIIETELSGRVKVHNIVQFFRDEVGLEAIAAKVKKPLAGLKVVPYYGCYMVKPRQVTGCPDAENPIAMDELLSALGAEVLDWAFKTECCGASLSLGKTERAVDLSSRLAREAAFRGADAIVVACQLCQSNLDLRAGQGGGSGRQVPVIYFTQLMGLAFGVAPAALGLGHHLVDPLAVLKQKGLIA